MAPQNDHDGFTGALVSNISSPEPALDHLAIFSAPAVEVVNHWWLESKRRWSEREREKALGVDVIK